MESEQILSEYGFVGLLGVLVSSNVVLGQLDAQVLGDGTKAAELVHHKLGFDDVLCVHLELQTLLAKLGEITFLPSQGTSSALMLTFVPILTGVSSSLS